MIKVFGLTPRAEGADRGTFDERWRAAGAPPVDAVERAIAAEPVTQEQSTEEATDMWAFGSPFPFAAIIELWFDSYAAFAGVRSKLDSFYREALGDALGEDGLTWLPTSENSVIAGDGPGRGLVKGVFFPHRLPGMSVADFQEYWRTKHAAIVPNTPHLVRYVQDHVLPEAYADGDEPFADGIAELWWRSLGEMEEALASDAFMVEQADDAQNFVDPDRQTGTVARETLL
jgi:uncharacterized protein (TIGR02118 family)